MPTMTTGTIPRTGYAQPSGNLYGREDTYFADGIALLETWRHPALAALQRAGTVRVDTRDVHWFEDELNPYTDQINYSTGYNSSATGLVVDNASYFKVGDLVRDVSSNEVMLVTSVGATFIGVVRDLGQSTESWTAKAASIADNAYLQVIGSAYEAGHTLPSFVTTLDVERVNYAQTHRTPVAVAEDVVEQAMRGEQQWPYQLRKKGVEHQMGIEKSFFFGKPYRGDKGIYNSTTGNTAPDTAGGVNHFLEQHGSSDKKVDQSELTEFEFLDFLEAAFDKGSKMKVMFCSSKLRTAFSKWGILKENTYETTRTLGMAIDYWQSSDGDLAIMTHDFLKRASSSDTEWNYAFVLDMENIQYCNFGPNGPTRLRNLDVYSATGETAMKAEYQTKFSFIIKLPDTHARLRFKTIAAA